MDNLTKEVQTSIAAGMRRLTVAQIDAELNALGYSREPGSRCTCIARNMSTGNSYPCTTYGIRHNETGLSAFNVDAPRGPAFEALQRLRLTCFAVARGSWVSI